MGLAGFQSDSTVESPARAHRCRVAARFEWVGWWLSDGHGHGVCDRNHLLACCATLLYAGFEVHSRVSRRFLRARGGGRESCFIATSSD